MGTVAEEPPITDQIAGDRLLIRRPTMTGWLASLPPAPEGAEVTVSLTDAAAAIRHAAELAARGYRPVGTAGSSHGGGYADFFVPRELTTSHAAWVRSVMGPSGRIYEPALGPVRILFGPVLAAHGA